MSFAASTIAPVLQDHVNHILRVRRKEKVIDVNAGGVVAPMAHAKPFWYRAHLFFVQVPCVHPALPVNPLNRIPVSVCGSGPYDTRSFIYGCSKLFVFGHCNPVASLKKARGFYLHALTAYVI